MQFNSAIFDVLSEKSENRPSLEFSWSQQKAEMDQTVA